MLEGASWLCGAAVSPVRLVSLCSIEEVLRKLDRSACSQCSRGHQQREKAVRRALAKVQNNHRREQRAMK